MDSKTVTFTVEKQKSFLIEATAIVLVIIIVVIVGVLLFRQRRKTISQNKPTFREKSIN
jgi:hypothetical protein